LAGHKELSTTERYMHLTPSALTAAIQLRDAGRAQDGRGDRRGSAARERPLARIVNWLGVRDDFRNWLIQCA